MTFYDFIFQEKINTLGYWYDRKRGNKSTSFPVMNPAKAFKRGEKAGSADKIVMFEQINQTTQTTGHGQHISVHQYSVKIWWVRFPLS